MKDHILPIGLIALGNLLDYVSTWYGLRQGLMEANFFINYFGLLNMKIASTLSLSLFCLWLSPANASPLGWAALLMYGAATTWNVIQILR